MKTVESTFNSCVQTFTDSVP